MTVCITLVKKERKRKRTAPKYPTTSNPIVSICSLVLPKRRGFILHVRDDEDRHPHGRVEKSVGEGEIVSRKPYCVVAVDGIFQEHGRKSDVRLCGIGN